jgi:hypothetical protein
MIKMAFKHSLFVKEKQIDSCFIYGVDANAISVANALNSKIHFVLELGFVDNNKKIRQN